MSLSADAERSDSGGADPGGGLAADAFHEHRAQSPDGREIGDVWRPREIVEIPLIDDDP